MKCKLYFALFVVALLSLFSIIYIFNTNNQNPSFSEIGLASIDEKDMKRIINNDSHTYRFYSDIDAMTYWLMNCESFHVFDNGPRKSLDYYKQIIISDLNFKAGSLLIEEVKKTSNGLFSLYVRCEYADETKDVNKLIVTIKIYKLHK